MKNLIIFCFVAFLGQSAFAQQSAATAPPQNAQFKVLGNCGMCKKTIEKAALGAGATTATWDMNTDLLAVTFDEKKTTTDAIQKAIAKAGY
ncbi:MAG: cation transporter, partial [Thermoanaerobaculia bacterium]|nr:cation transporter [Thermoanaerobaculia bacterium]